MNAEVDLDLDLDLDLDMDVCTEHADSSMRDGFGLSPVARLQHCEPVSVMAIPPNLAMLGTSVMASMYCWSRRFLVLAANFQELQLPSSAEGRLRRLSRFLGAFGGVKLSLSRLVKTSAAGVARRQLCGRNRRRRC